MAYDTTTTVVDDVDDNLALYHNELKTAIDHLMSASSYASYVRTQSMTANVTLTDADLPIQSFSPTAARDLTLRAVASTNHPFYVWNRSGAYAITVKNASAVVIAVLQPYSHVTLQTDGANGWYVIGTSERETRYKLTPSIASSNLTVTLTHMDGTTPATSRPLWFKIGDAWRAVSGALSVSVTAALGDIFLWDTGKIQGNDAQIFVYMIDNNGTAQIGVSPCPMLVTVATNYYSNGSQTGAAGHTNIVMSGTRDATNTCCVVGRVNVSQTDANNWQSPTSAKIVNDPVYNTDPMNWTPSPTATAPMTLTTPVVDEAYYAVEQWDVHYTLRITATTATTASAAIRATVPIASDVSTNFPTIGHAIVNDGGGNLAGTCSIGAGLIIIGRYDGGNFGLGAGRTVRASGEYRYA